MSVVDPFCGSGGLSVGPFRPFGTCALVAIQASFDCCPEFSVSFKAGFP